MTSARDMNALLAFWLDEVGPKGWFEVNPAVDTAIRDRWGALWQEAREGQFTGWGDGPRETLAFLILLDQFSRNMFRGDGRSFATDALARDVARRAVARNLDLEVAGDARSFFYLPFEHSESLADQDRSVELFRALANAAPPELAKDAAMLTQYAEKHRAVIARFGRFPHRNKVLGRESTAEEEEFLKSGRGF